MPRYIEVRLTHVKTLVGTLIDGDPYNRTDPLTIEAFMSNGGRNTGPAGEAKREKRRLWLEQHAECSIEECSHCSYLYPGYQISYAVGIRSDLAAKLCGTCFDARAYRCGECGGSFVSNFHPPRYHGGSSSGVCPVCANDHFRDCSGCSYMQRNDEIGPSGLCVSCARGRERTPQRPIRPETVLSYNTRAEQHLERPWLQLSGEKTDKNDVTTPPQLIRYNRDDIPRETFRQRQENEHPESFFVRIRDDWEARQRGVSHGPRGCTGADAADARAAFDIWYASGRNPVPYNLKAAPTMWLGFELEAVCKAGQGGMNKAANAVTEAFDGRGICKADGSIDQGGQTPGFEMVSLPGTLAYHQTQWRDWLKTVQKHMRGWDAPTCGMHVHVSRRALTALQIARVGVFLGATGNRDFVVRVAGRTADQYARVLHKGFHSFRNADDYSTRTLLGNFTRGRPGRSGQYMRRSDKYEALNVGNPATVELRLFQANVATAGFLKNIDFAHAVFAWAASASNRELTAPAFLAWIDRNRGVYPNFTLWAVRDGLLAKRHNEAEERQLCA